jgi:hypothetical protein
MALIEFACPHCQACFQVDDPPPGRPLACPHCQQLMALPGSTSLGPPSAPLPSLAGPAAPDESAGVALPFDPLDVEFGAVRRRRGRRQVGPDRAVGGMQLNPAQRKRRRQLRSTIVMLLCGLVLIVAVVLLSRL